MKSTALCRYIQKSALKERGAKVAQNRNNQGQGSGQQAGTMPRRTLALEVLKEEQVEGGVRALLQARVVQGRKAGDNEPLTLVVAGVGMEFGGFFEPASGLAHWERFVPSGEEHVFQVVDAQGSVSLLKRVSAKAPPPSKRAPEYLEVDLAPIGPGTYSLLIAVLDESRKPIPESPVFVRYEGATEGDLKTGEDGTVEHEVVVGSGERIDVTVSAAGLRRWSRPLFGARPIKTGAVRG